MVDFWGVTKRPPNALWVQDIDADGFYRLLGERLARL
jgi:purine nucleosidase